MLPVMNGVWIRGSLSGRWGDVWLGLAASGVTAAALGAGLTGPGKVPLDLAGWMLAPVIGLLLLLRRQFPVVVLLGSTAVLFAYYGVGYPPVGLALPLAGAFFSAAETGRQWWAIAVAVVAVAVAYGYRSAIGQDPGFLFGYDLVQTLVVLGGMIAAGDAVRSRRRERSQAAERAAFDAERREQEARRTVEQERGRLARDVHDVLAHTLAVVSLHSDVAAEALADDPKAAAEALRNVRGASREALRELRGYLDLLRADDVHDRQPAGSLRDLDALADRARGSGLAVTLDVHGGPRLPSTVDSTAFRIVQEALTNVLRHARADAAEVSVRYPPGRVEVQVRDDGCGRASPVPGHGLTGMRERAGLLGGTLVAEPLAPHGFLVSASIPFEEASV